MDDSKLRAVHEACQDSEETGVAVQEFDVVRLKVCDFHSVISVLSTKIKSKGSQKQKCTN